MAINRIGRPLALTSTAPARPQRVGRDDTAMLSDLADRLGVDDAGDWSRITKLQRYLNDKGIDSVDELEDMFNTAAQDSTRRANGRFVAPPAPQRSLSLLFSDVEIIDWLKVDTEIIPIPTVAIGLTTDITIAQAPVRWSITDFTADGAVAASGRKDMVEIRVVLGTTEITKFRLSAMDKTSSDAMVVDALGKIYNYEIGPNSTLKVRVVNLNSGAGQAYDGYFQYTRRPVLDDALRTLMSRLAL